MRRLFERFALVPDGIIVAIAMILVGLLFGGQAAAQGTGPVVSNPPIQNANGSWTYTYTVTVPDENCNPPNKKPCKDFHLECGTGTIGGTPGPATAGAPGRPGGGGALPGWGVSGGQGGRDVHWRMTDTNGQPVPPGGTFTVSITTPPGNGDVPPLNPAKFTITSDGALQISPAGTICRSARALLHVPGRRTGVVSYVSVVPAGGWAALCGYTGEREPRTYAILFGTGVANPPVSMGGIDVPLTGPNELLMLSLTPFVRNGTGVSDFEGEFDAEAYLPSALPSGFQLYFALMYFDPVLGWVVSEPSSLTVQ